MARSADKTTRKARASRHSEAGRTTRASKPKRRGKTEPAYFLSLNVENVRCFGPRQTLDLSDSTGRPARWTVLIGDNGTGKTTLLECLEAIQPEVQQFHEGEAPMTAAGLLFDRWSGLQRAREARNRVAASFAVGTELTDAASSEDQFELYHELVAMNSRRTGLVNRTLRLFEAACYGYGAHRRPAPTALSDDEAREDSATIFSDSGDLRSAEEWLLRADYAAKRAKKSTKLAQRRDQIRNALVDILPEVTDVRITQPSDAAGGARAEFKTPYGWVPTRGLGLGYRTMIAWMVDFASRLFERYPRKRNPLAEPAVVLVDEIDLHLHPKWQRTLMGYLSERFPNTQFIVTAHSPLVVQAAADANIVVLRREGDHVVIDNDPTVVREWRLDQLLTSDLFGLDSARAPEVADLLARRAALLGKARLTAADTSKLAEIEKQIGQLPTGETPEQIEAMDIIRRAARRLKKEGKTG